MQRACDIGKKRKLDPSLRRYTLTSAVIFGLTGLVIGFWAGLKVVSHQNALDAPFLEKFFLNTFLALSGGGMGVIFGAFIGSTVYRLKTKK